MLLSTAFFAIIPQCVRNLCKVTVVPKKKKNTVVMGPGRPPHLHTPSSWINLLTVTFKQNSQLLLNNNNYSQYELKIDLIWHSWSYCAWFIGARCPFSIQTEFKSPSLCLTEGFVLYSMQWLNSVIKSLTSHFTSSGRRCCSPLVCELSMSLASFNLI